MKTATKFLIDRGVARPMAWAANVGARVVGQILQRDHVVRPESIRTIVVAKLLGMGSIVQATPLLHDLRATFPRARLVFLTTRANRALIERLDVIDEATYVDDARPDTLMMSSGKAVADLVRRNIDLYFDLEVYSAGASILSVASGAKNRVGLYRESARFKEGIYTHLTVFNPRAAISSIYRQLNRSVGGSSSGPAVFGPIRVRETDDASLANTLARNSLTLDERFVVVNPNASDLLLERRWPTEKYVSLIAELAKTQQVVLVGAKSEADYVRRIVEAIPSAVRPRVLDTSGRLNLGELFSLLQRAAVVVTNDTGPMHFSIALGRPTVCLFGPVSPAHYGVHKANVETLYHAVYCSPCAHELDAPPCAGNNVCMQLIGVDETLAAVERLLAGKPSRSVLPTLPELHFSGPSGEALGVIVRASVETRPSSD